MQLKTYKAAREAGYLLADRLVELTGLVPRPGESAKTIKEKNYYHLSQLEQCISQTEGKHRGLRLRKRASPVANRQFWNRETGSITYCVYRLSDFERRIPRRERSAITIPLLDAIWLVNKAAKTQRDLASRYYNVGMHGFAGNSRSLKEELYELKERGIAYALSQNVLAWQGWHGNMSVVEGEGFRFHTRLRPNDVTASPEEVAYWKAEVSNRRLSRKCRLKDAVYTLECLEDRVDQFVVSELPWTNERNRSEDRRHQRWNDDDHDNDIEDEEDSGPLGRAKYRYSAR